MVCGDDYDGVLCVCGGDCDGVLCVCVVVTMTVSCVCVVMSMMVSFVVCGDDCDGVLWCVVMTMMYLSSQTPPAIPTLFVVVFSSIIRGSRLIVDYHNYGHTLLALTHGPEHATVKLARE